MLVIRIDPAAAPLSVAAVPVVVAHGDPHGQAAPCSPVRAARRTSGRGPPCPHRWELLTVAHPCPYKGVAVDQIGPPLTRCSLPVPVINHHHFATTGADIAQLGALVTTRTEGSPLVDATRHTIVAALTPAAAAALLRTLEGQALPLEVAHLVAGLRGAALHALGEA